MILQTVLFYPHFFNFFKREGSSNALKKFENDGKLIVLPDNKYLLPNYHKNQTLKNQSMFKSVLEDLLALIMDGSGDVITKLEDNPIFIDAFLVRIVKFGEKHFFKSKTATDQNTDVIRLSLSLINLLRDVFDKRQVKALIDRYIDTYNICVDSTNEAPTIHSANTVPTQCQHNDDNKTKVKRKETKDKLKESSLCLGSGRGISRGILNSRNIESNKILSLGGQNFKDSQDGSQEPSREGLIRKSKCSNI